MLLPSEERNFEKVSTFNEEPFECKGLGEDRKGRESTRFPSGRSEFGARSGRVVRDAWRGAVSVRRVRGARLQKQRPLITSRKNADVGSNKGPPAQPPMSNLPMRTLRRSCTLRISSLITADLHISSRAGPSNFVLLSLPTGLPLASAPLLAAETLAKRPVPITSCSFEFRHLSRGERAREKEIKKRKRK